MKNYLPKQYKKTKKLKINHSYLVEQFADYSKIFKEIEKIVKKEIILLVKRLMNLKEILLKELGQNL